MKQCKVENFDFDILTEIMAFGIYLKNWFLGLEFKFQTIFLFIKKYLVTFTPLYDMHSKTKNDHSKYEDPQPPVFKWEYWFC